MIETIEEITKDNLISTLNAYKAAGYTVLMDLTGVDYLYPTPRTKVLYFLHNPETQARNLLAVYVSRDESLPSCTSIWEGANWYERELYDLLGVRFDDHPALTRILMPDDWVGHPLCRDYPLTEEAVQFKHERKPKIPSQIIGYVENNQRL